MELVNLTPHPVVVYGQFDTPQIELPACEKPARLVYREEFIGHCLKRKTPLYAENLPEAKKGTFLVVSSVLRSAFPARTDLLSPVGNETRTVDGKEVKGCRYLSN